MDRTTLVKTWTVVHLFAIYAGVNAILLLQDSPVTLPTIISIREEAMRGRSSTAAIWFFIAAVPLTFSALLAIAYLRAYRTAQTRTCAAPAMFNAELIGTSWLARSYQIFWLVICAGASAYGVSHAARTVLRAELYECDMRPSNTTQVFRPSGNIFSGVIPRNGGKDVRFDGCGEPKAGDGRTAPPKGVEYVPFVNDILVGAVWFASMILVLIFWILWLFPAFPRLRSRN